MPQVNESSLRTLIDAGVPVRLTAIPQPLDMKGYIVVVDTGRIERHELMTKRGTVRTFKQLETLYKFCKSLGLKGFEVQVR